MPSGNISSGVEGKLREGLIAAKRNDNFAIEGEHPQSTLTEITEPGSV